MKHGLWKLRNLRRSETWSFAILSLLTMAIWGLSFFASLAVAP